MDLSTLDAALSALAIAQKSEPSNPAFERARKLLNLERAQMARAEETARQDAPVPLRAKR